MSVGEPLVKRAKLVEPGDSAGEPILAAPLVTAPHGAWFRPEATAPDTAALNSKIVRDSEATAELPEEGAHATKVAKEKFFVHGKSFEDLVLPGLSSAHTVGARLFKPTGCVVEAALLHIHGGGFISGSAYGQNDTRLEALCETCGLAVLSVEYRLAPEHTHPAAGDDCLAAARWLASEGRARLGCDTLMLVGESSGANLAASLLLRLRDESSSGKTPFSAACLVYGVYDAALTPSARNWGTRRLICNTRELEWWVNAYAGKDADLRDPLLSPLHGDLRGMPPALFVVGTEDCLLDDSLFMHARWAAAGNESSLALFPGGAHGVGHFGPHKDTAQGVKVRATLEAFYLKHLPSTLLDTESCSLQRVAPDASIPPVGENVCEYWLLQESSGQVSAVQRSAGVASERQPFGKVLLLQVQKMTPGAGGGSSGTGALPDGGVPVGTRLLLSDATVNIWEFRLSPGESCPFHKHRLPYFFTNLTASLTKALSQDGSPLDEPPSYQRRGQSIFVGRDRLGEHGVQNVGEGTFLQFVVELKGI